MTGGADGYVYRPTTVDQVAEVFALAQAAGRRVVLRGAGRSYGDAAYASEAVVLDITRMDRILGWDPEIGMIEVEGGATLGAIWQHTLEDGWWLPVVSGTMFPTIAGALAMNIHGKNHFAAGSLGEHIQEIDVVAPSGGLRTLRREEELFRAVIGSAGLLGAITRVKLQMKRVRSGDLRVLPVSCANWEEQFATFERMIPEASPDYMVSWVDCFARGTNAGRGLIHAAWYTEEEGELPASLSLSHQQLPETMLGIPKSRMWRWMKPWTNRLGMRMINWAKYSASRRLGNGIPHSQSLAEFSFLLDYVPNWQKVYSRGFIQYQSFVPRESARQVFSRQIELAQSTNLEPMLGVLKRHRPDPFLLTWALDGYSLALDFRITEGNWPRIQELCWRMNDLVLEAGGRFYFAKDSTLRPSDVRAYLGDTVLSEFRDIKNSFDSDGLLTSSLAERVGLVG